MAKMKIEVLHHYHERHGLPHKDRLIAYLPRYAPLASRLAPVMNALQSAFKNMLGFAPQRSLPQWRSDAFKDSVPRPTPLPGLRGERAGQSGQSAGEVVLLVDTFNRYFEPENARAALQVLQAAGYTVHLPRAADSARPLCCGRTFLASGLVDQARHEAKRMLEALEPYIARGVPVVGLEPSCLYSLRDEFLSMLPSGETAELALNAFLLENFIARELDAGRFKLKLKSLPQKKALLHGHCHQKAFAAMPAVQRALKLIPELDVELIESSCCGMAGSFGYEARHYEVSLRMAEASLLPKVRAAGTDSLIIADGTSCRHQIHDATAREAVHVARVLAAALQ
jgi:Fe-S oxidoreductase